MCEHLQKLMSDYKKKKKGWGAEDVVKHLKYFIWVTGKVNTRLFSLFPYQKRDNLAEVSSFSNCSHNCQKIKLFRILNLDNMLWHRVTTTFRFMGCDQSTIATTMINLI